jgi:hypothetical protein
MELPPLHFQQVAIMNRSPGVLDMLATAYARANNRTEVLLSFAKIQDCAGEDAPWSIVSLKLG